MRSPIKLLAACAIVFGLANTASATPVPITNPSFELPDLACAAGPNCFLNSVTGWNISATNNLTTVFKPSGTSFSAIPDGDQVLAIGNQSGTGFASQTLSAVILPNTTYTLSAMVGARADFPLGGYTIELRAGGSVLAAHTNFVTPAAGTFSLDTLTFTTGANLGALTGLNLGIVLSGTGLTALGAAAQTDFDLVTLDAVTQAGPPSVVPEPATLALVGLGVLGMRRRFLRHRSNS